jgi:hypothetical protein
LVRRYVGHITIIHLIIPVDDCKPGWGVVWVIGELVCAPIYNFLNRCSIWLRVTGAVSYIVNQVHGQRIGRRSKGAESEKGDNVLI